jgi:hypothetical protein
VEIRAALSGSPLAWHRIFDKGLLGPDNNMVYDTKRKTLVVFGGVPLSNDIAIYEPATRRHQIMPTPGPRPPKYRFAPMSLPSEAWQDRGARRAAWSAGAIRSRRHH